MTFKSRSGQQLFCATDRQTPTDRYCGYLCFGRWRMMNDIRELKHQTFLIHERHGWTRRTGSRVRFTRQMQIIKQARVKPSRTLTE